MGIKIYSFFAGCGLLDLGLELAGFDISLVIEKYRPFLGAYFFSRERMNIKLPEHGCFNVDINDCLANDSIIDSFLQEDKKRNFVGFIGGPPCPDFSTAGKNRGVRGDNGKLSKVYFDLIAKKKPDFFVFENVKGLWKTKKHRDFYDKMYRKMRRNGYCIIDGLCNALDYGVPQERERVFMIGVKYEDAIQRKILKILMKNFRWGITERNLQEKIKYAKWPLMDKFVENSCTEAPCGCIKEVTVEYWFKKNKVYKHANADNFFKPKAGIEKMRQVDEGDVSRKSYKRLHRWRFAPTAAYGNNEVHLHPYKVRRLSVAEVLAIQSAPASFELPRNMSLTDMFKTVGNGVPVLMAEGIGRELYLLLEKYIKTM